MTAAEAAQGEPVRRVLVIGQSPFVIETVLAELAELGLAASGTVRPDRATADFDARDFDLIAFGGGVTAATRREAKAAFTNAHPEVRLVDAFAPAAARQILDALNEDCSRDRVDLGTYFRRVGYVGPREATLDVLRSVQARHLDAVPFEAIDVLLGRGVDLAPEAVDAKIIGARRGGYCFEQNGLFRRVLRTLGFDVAGLTGRVRWNRPAGSPVPPRTHMVLRVTLDETPWLVDVGFGGSVPPAPLRIDTAEPQVTAHGTYRVFPFGAALLVQVQKDDQWASLYEVPTDLQHQADFEMSNWYTSTHPASHFRKTLSAARTSPEKRYALLESRLTVRHVDGGIEQFTLDTDGLEEALVDTFGLPVEADWRPLFERAAASTA